MRTFVKSLFAAILLVCAMRPAAAGPALLFDPSNGMVLYAEDMDNQWHPASLTKIMTAYLVFEDLKAGKIKRDTLITCTELAHKQPPSKVGLPIGAKMRIETALKSLIIKSANDVAVMIAEALGPSHGRFIARMNATAKRLGMTRTHFVNPNGLPAKAQVTTARDLAKLSRAVVNEFPEYASFWSTPSFRLGKVRLSSYNSLLRTFDGADGLKTGFICDSGFNIVASAQRDGRRLMAIVLGEPSGVDRGIRATSLLEHGFRQYGWKTLFNTNRIDNMPMNVDAEDVRSVRHTVTSYSCGNRRTAKKLKRMKAIAKARRAQRLGLTSPGSSKRKAVPKPKAQTIKLKPTARIKLPTRAN
ncbi:MAG: D-alanyl-D-alanine carboxypeptidase family protein [Pseudomonadota bacterium]